MYRSINFAIVIVCLMPWSCLRSDAQDLGSQPLLRVLAAYDANRPGGTRIIGGHDTTIAAHPWQVALVATRVAANDKSQFCGGSVIGARWVLTAAHCVDGGTRPDQIAVLTGTASLVDVGVRVSVAPQGILVHPRWNSKTHDSDLALIRASSDLGGKAIVGLRANDTGPSQGQDITVTGWGSRSWDSSIGTNILQEVSVPFQPQMTCNQKGSYGGHVTDNMFCAGKTGEDACQRDSGGPATFTVSTETRLVGVVSWGDKCGVPLKYGVYTRIAQFAAWVKDQTSGEVSW